MRLSEYEIEVIVSCAKENFGKNTSVILFGSRAIDIKKGGDIDLLVKPGIKASLEEMIQKKLIMLMELDQKLGEQKIDLLLQQPGDRRTIIKTAEENGIAIC